ncbi:hypothetical protein BLNAU_5382 [Blattamonas nauphoetae]|uniref:Uncharacterized protein n=1 Tax=Blattamonas nauphoetae TaxID=2049346 RepID=A0ABQ9Y7F7_9EUKA|nr:hypothetical protein BLNAU_5382 [Blattamonas nauphoetae]
MPALLPSRVTTQVSLCHNTPLQPKPPSVNCSFLSSKGGRRDENVGESANMPELNQVSFPQGCLLALSLNFHDIVNCCFPSVKGGRRDENVGESANMPELNQVSFSQGCLLALSLNCHDLVSADEAFVFDCFEFTANCQFIKPVPLVVGLVTGFVSILNTLGSVFFGNLARNLSSAVNLFLFPGVKSPQLRIACSTQLYSSPQIPSYHFSLSHPKSVLNSYSAFLDFDARLTSDGLCLSILPFFAPSAAAVNHAVEGNCYGWWLVISQQSFPLTEWRILNSHPTICSEKMPPISDSGLLTAEKEIVGGMWESIVTSGTMTLPRIDGTIVNVVISKLENDFPEVVISFNTDVERWTIT